MPSNFTENFNLSQWEAGDKVHHDDFNEDNRKIDAAFLNHPSAELIDSLTVEEETKLIKLDISQVDWSRYMALAVIVHAAEYGGFRADIGSVGRCAYLTSMGATYGNSSAADVSHAAQITMLIPVFYDGSHEASALSFGVGVYNSSKYAVLSYGGTPSPLNQCGIIEIWRITGSLWPGDKALIWGIK